LKIDNSSPSRHLEATGSRQSAKAGVTTGAAAAPAAGPGSITHLSLGAQDPSLDIDQARVDEIRQAIREGKLTLDSGKIADGLLASIQAQLAQE
jgi:negative regulator of flagellin synthesis FlgM